MIAWNSYKTTTVAPSFIGDRELGNYQSSSGILSHPDVVYEEHFNRYTESKLQSTSGSTSYFSNLSRTNSTSVRYETTNNVIDWQALAFDTNKKGRWATQQSYFAIREGGTTHDKDSYTATYSGSTNSPQGTFSSSESGLRPKAIISPETTTITTRNTTIALTTVSAIGYTSYWTTNTQRSFNVTSSQTSSTTITTFTRSWKTTQSMRGLSTQTIYSDTITTNKTNTSEFLEFVTFTGTSADQVVVADRIFMDKKGFLYVIYTNSNAYKQALGNYYFFESPSFSDWEAITKYTLSSATKTTVSFQNFSGTFSVADVSTTSTITITKTSYAIPFHSVEYDSIATITGFSYDYNLEEEVEANTYVLSVAQVDATDTSYSFTDISYATSLITNFSESSYGSSSASDIYKTVTVYMSWETQFSQGITKSGNGAFNNSEDRFFSIGGYGGAIVPSLDLVAYGGFDLDLKSDSSGFSSYATSITFNNANENFDFIINIPFGEGVANGKNIPLPFPAFTAYQTTWGNSSQWTTMQVSRIAESFSSTVFWNVNSTSNTSSTGSALLNKSGELPVGVSELTQNVYGGRVNFNTKFTAINPPGLLLKTTYNNAGYGTESNIYTVIKAQTSFASNANSNITISSFLPIVLALGISFFEPVDVN